MRRKPKGSIIPATPSDVWNVVNDAAPGDTVQLTSGTYPLNLWGIQKPGEVVIEPQPGADLNILGANVNSSAFLTLRGLPIKIGADYQYGVQAWDGCSNILLENLDIQGPTTDPATLSGVGVHIRFTGGPVTLRNSILHNLGSGLGGSDAAGILIERNHLENLQADGMIFGGVQDTVVQDNTGTNFNYPEWVHPDFIQWFCTADTVTKNLKILRNRFDRGSGMLVQGIFGEDGEYIYIEDNIIYGPMYNGIALARTKHFTMKRNFVQPLTVEGDMDCWMMVRQEADDGDVSDNAAPEVIVGTSGEPQPTNIRVSNTTPTVAAPPGDTSQYDAWKATLEPIPPDPGPDPDPPCRALVEKVIEQAKEIDALNAELEAKEAENAELHTVIDAQAAKMAEAVTILSEPVVLE
jgi:hypothetical protein